MDTKYIELAFDQGSGVALDIEDGRVKIIIPTWDIDTGVKAEDRLMYMSPIQIEEEIKNVDAQITELKRVVEILQSLKDAVIAMDPNIFIIKPKELVV